MLVFIKGSWVKGFGNFLNGWDLQNGTSTYKLTYKWDKDSLIIKMTRFLKQCITKPCELLMLIILKLLKIFYYENPLSGPSNEWSRCMGSFHTKSTACPLWDDTNICGKTIITAHIKKKSAPTLQSNLSLSLGLLLLLSIYHYRLLDYVPLIGNWRCPIT